MTREPLVEDIQNYALNIVDTVASPFLSSTPPCECGSANRAFYQTFHVTSEETENRLIYELGNGQWDIPALRTLLEDVVPKSSVFNDFELEHTFPVIGRRVMLLNARKLQAGRHGELLVLAMEDVTRASGRRKRWPKPGRCRARSSTAPISQASPPTKRASFKSSTSAPSACWVIRLPR